MLLIVRPLIDRFAELPVILCALAACAGATQLIGLHSVLGAFFFGLLVRRCPHPNLADHLQRQVIPVTTSVLLPVYFLGPGLHVDLRSLEPRALIQFAAIMVCACGGKLIGASVPARASGLRWREAALVGALLNTRGLIELVVLNVGRTTGILDPSLFSVLVVMAVGTTVMTGPLIDRLRPGRGSDERVWLESLGDPSTPTRAVTT